MDGTTKSSSEGRNLKHEIWRHGGSDHEMLKPMLLDSLLYVWLDYQLLHFAEVRQWQKSSQAMAYEFEIKTLAAISSLEVLLDGKDAPPVGCTFEDVKENLNDVIHKYGKLVQWNVWWKRAMPLLSCAL